MSIRTDVNINFLYELKLMYNHFYFNVKRISLSVWYTILRTRLYWVKTTKIIQRRETLWKISTRQNLHFYGLYFRTETNEGTSINFSVYLRKSLHETKGSFHMKYCNLTCFRCRRRSICVYLKS